MKASSLRVLAEDILHLLHGAREIVVRVERAAGDLLPAVLAGQLVPGAAADFAPARVSRIPCMRSLWFAAAAPPDWMQIVPPFGLICCASFARLTPIS